MLIDTNNQISSDFLFIYCQFIIENLLSKAAAKHGWQVGKRMNMVVEKETTH